MINSIVTACDREPSYLDCTMKSLKEAGFKPRVYRDRHDYHILSKRNSTRLGIVVSFRIALARVVSGACSHVCIFQDDIVVAKNLCEWLEENAPTTGVVSLYTSSKFDGHGDGFRKLDLSKGPAVYDNGIGACAFLMDIMSADTLLQVPPPPENRQLGKWIARVCRRMDIPFWIHNPSLVQHIGEISSGGAKWESDDRVAARFCEDARML